MTAPDMEKAVDVEKLIRETKRLTGYWTAEERDFVIAQLRSLSFTRQREEIARIIDNELGDIEVEDGRCKWTDVANAQTHIEAQLRALPAPECRAGELPDNESLARFLDPVAWEEADRERAAGYPFLHEQWCLERTRYSTQQATELLEFLTERAASASPPSAEGWIAVKDQLPKFKQTVLVRYPSGYDSSDLYAFGGRIDGENENGEPAWMWGIKQGYGGITPGKDADYNDVEADDDYSVTHWMPLPAAPLVAAPGERPQIVGRVTGAIYEGDQVPGMPHAICHACGLKNYPCVNPDCPNAPLVAEPGEKCTCESGHDRPYWTCPVHGYVTVDQ